MKILWRKGVFKLLTIIASWHGELNSDVILKGNSESFLTNVCSSNGPSLYSTSISTRFICPLNSINLVLHMQASKYEPRSWKELYIFKHKKINLILLRHVYNQKEIKGNYFWPQFLLVIMPHSHHTNYWDG